MKSPCAESRRAQPLLGTIVEIVVRSDGQQPTSEAIDQAFAAISIVQQRMSFHDPNSVLSQLNAEAFARPVQIDEKTFRVLEMARNLNAFSDGLFDPAIAPELQRAEFLPKLKWELRADWGRGSFADVELLSENRVRFRHPDVRLDLGGLAKGFAVDEAVSVLRAAGINSALVNAGGDLRVFGCHSFPVEIRNPWRLGRTLGPFRAKNVAIATSAHYFADRLKPDALIGPFVDPRFRELRGDLLSVSVSAPSAMVADALTKIVMLNPAQSPALLRRFAAAALVYDPAGSVLCTPNWHEIHQAAA
jgi:thiamine biosynthesis lipoprotein